MQAEIASSNASNSVSFKPPELEMSADKFEHFERRRDTSEAIVATDRQLSIEYGGGRRQYALDLMDETV
jgi:hypothetical protein